MLSYGSTYKHTNMNTNANFDTGFFVVDQYLERSIQSIDSKLGQGYARKNPNLIAAMLQVSDNTFRGNGYGI
tara:strand:+ start:350 stop:565 length:216 start_codon:yes stop_codon:yes gene_type:complete